MLAIGADAVVGQNNSLVLGNGVNVGIGTSTPNQSAILDLTSTTKGFLLPRMTESQMFNIPNPADGLMIYNTTQQQIYYRNGGYWQSIPLYREGDKESRDKIEILQKQIEELKAEIVALKNK